jgi:RimJ/RimL family protein N-acetyltransferase
MTSRLPVPLRVVTDRLLLRPWRRDDAAELLPVLVANQAHIAPWIPHRVSAVVSEEALGDRLDGFATLFQQAREWRYALRTRAAGVAAADDDGEDGTIVLGEVDLFPRNADGRVAFPEADRAEIGYWLREDMTGRGLVTQAVRAIIEVARACGTFAELEIRCDARNLPSAAVPRRLGFRLAHTELEGGVGVGEGPVELQTWTLPLDGTHGAAAFRTPR